MAATDESNVIVSAKRKKKNALPFACWRVTINGKDLTDILDPLLFKVSLTEKTGKEADELQIEIWDKDGTVEIPPHGAKIICELGWLRGKGLPSGLVDKGTFKVDDTSVHGIKGTINIGAKSADFASDFNKRRNHSYINKTVYQILNDIGARNGLGVLCDADLGGEPVSSLVKRNASDGAVLQILGRKFDASANVKNGNIYFAKHGSAKTPKGTTIPLFEIDVTEIDPESFEYGKSERDNDNGAEAEYHDLKTGKKTKVTHGVDPKSGKKPQKVKKTYHKKEDAEKAAKAHAQKAKRKVTQCTITLPFGRPDLFPNYRVKLTNFKKPISATTWLIKEISHEMGSDGLTSTLSLESA